MSMLKEVLRLVAAAAVLGIVTVATSAPSSLQAAEENGYCLQSPGAYCVSTEGGGAAFGWACDAGACETCTSGGGRCAPFGSGVDIEGYWP